MAESGNLHLGAPSESTSTPSKSTSTHSSTPTPAITSSPLLKKSWITSASDGVWTLVGKLVKRPEPSPNPLSGALSHDASWDAKLNAFRSLVGQDTVLEIQFNNSMDQLETYTKNFKTAPKTHLSPASLKSVDVVVDGLKAVVGIATALAPTSPEIGTIIRGSTRLISANSRHRELTDLVLKYFTPISQKFELFWKYISMFPASKPLEKAVEAFCQSVVIFLDYCVKTLKARWIDLPVLASFEESLRRMVEQISHESKHVERQFQVAKAEEDQLQWKKHEIPVIPPQQALQPSSCLDIPVNRIFRGRQDITQKLREHLMGPESKPRPGRSALLYGMGGMGKSSIAINFVYDRDHIDIFERRVFWLSMDTKQKALTAAAQACRALGIQLGDEAHELAKAPSVWRGWLEQHDSWLVVYDNVEDGDLLWELWPRTTKGTIIVTSRQPEVTGTLLQNGIRIDVGALPLSETRKLLFEFLPPKYYADLSSNPEQVVMADQICQLLDGLPMAVELTAAMMRQTLRSMADTLKLLTEKREIFMEFKPSNNGGPSLALGMLWEANIASLPDSSRKLLQIMAFLDPDKVQEEIFLDKRVSTLDNGIPSDYEGYLDCLRNLSGYCLVRRDNATISVHRLLQDAIIHRMDPMTDLPAAFAAAVDLVWSLFPKQSQNGLLMSSVLEVAQHYLPHVESLGTRYREVGSSIGYKSERLAELVYGCSWTMLERGMLEPAMKMARTGLDITQALSSETRLLQADLWTTIGAAQVAGSRLEQSYKSLQRAFDLRLEVVEAGLIDPTHPQIANSYMSLGTAAVGIGCVQEAIDLGEKSIRMREGRFEEQMQVLALSHHNVALASLTCGQLNKADAFIDKSMEISAETCQSMTLEQKKAMDCRNIYCKGNIFWARGMKNDARERHANALQVRLRTFGEAHPYSACSYWKLGQVWEEEDWKKAEEHYTRSVELYERLTMVEACLGRALWHLGRLQRKHGVLGGSKHIDRAHDLFLKITGDRFPEIEDEDSRNPFARLIHPFYS